MSITILFGKIADSWRQDPVFNREYLILKDEFATAEMHCSEMTENNFADSAGRQITNRNGIVTHPDG